MPILRYALHIHECGQVWDVNLDVFPTTQHMEVGLSCAHPIEGEVSCNLNPNSRIFVKSSILQSWYCHILIWDNFYKIRSMAFKISTCAVRHFTARRRVRRGYFFFCFPQGLLVHFAYRG